MEFISDLNGYATVDGAASLSSDLAGRAYVNAASPLDEELDVLAEIDGSAGEAAHAGRTGVVQHAGFEIYLDGILVNRGLLGETISVTRSYDERLQSYSFDVHLTTPTGPFGSPFGCNIPPTRQKRIDVYGVYKTSTGIHRVPLITGGIAHAVSRRGSDSGFIESYSGVDRGGRFDQKLIDAVFPPGHGLTRDVVLKKCAEKAGETQFRLETGNRMLKEFQLADSAFIEPCSEVLDIENRRILWNDRGELTNPQIGRPRSNEPTRWTLTERDLTAAEEVTVDFKADAITEVVVNGTEQLTAEQCGDIVITTTLEAKDIAAPQPPAYSQTAGGYAANAGYPATDYTEPKTVQIDVITRIERCNVEIYQRKETYQFYNPQVARYEWDSVADEWDRLGGGGYGFVGTTDDEDDENPGYGFNAPRWGLVAVDELWTAWYQVGYRGNEIGIPGYGLGIGAFVDGRWIGLEQPVMDDITPTRYVGIVDGVLVNAGFPDGEGYVYHKIGTLSRSHRMAFYRKAVKKRTVGAYPLQAFDEIEPFAGLAGNKYVMADKTGFDSSPDLTYFSSNAGDSRGETLLLTEQILEAYKADSKHFLSGKYVIRWGIGNRRGNSEGEYWFGPDQVSSEAQDSYRQLRTETELYAAVGDKNHDIFRSATDDLEGEPAPSTSEFNVEGYLPAVDVLPMAEVDTSLYDSEEEQAAISAATMRTTTRPIEVTVRAEDLENCGHEWAKLVIDLPWAENADEADFAAHAIIDESAAADVNLPVAGAHFFIRECDLVLAQFRPIDLNDVIRVQVVNWSGGGRSPITTNVKGKLYHG